MITTFQTPKLAVSRVFHESRPARYHLLCEKRRNGSCMRKGMQAAIRINGAEVFYPVYEDRWVSLRHFQPGDCPHTASLSQSFPAIFDPYPDQATRLSTIATLPHDNPAEPQILVSFDLKVKEAANLSRRASHSRLREQATSRTCHFCK